MRCTWLRLCGTKAAVERLAFSRMRHDDKNMLNRESAGILPSAKIGLIQHVGCIAVLDGWRASACCKRILLSCFRHGLLVRNELN